MTIKDFHDFLLWTEKARWKFNNGWWIHKNCTPCSTTELYEFYLTKTHLTK